MTMPVTLRLLDADAWATLCAQVSFKFFAERAKHGFRIQRLTVYLEAATGRLELTAHSQGLKRHQQFVLGYVTRWRDDVFRFHGPLWGGMEGEIANAFAAQGRRGEVVRPKVTGVRPA